MSILGSSQRWYAALVDMYDIIYEAIVRVWPDCHRRVPRASSMAGTSRRGRVRQAREDPITRSLIMHLRRDRIIRDAPIHIESQLELLPDDPQADPKPLGYLDICVLFLTGSDKLYLECVAERKLSVSVSASNPRSTKCSSWVEKPLFFPVCLEV